MKRFLKIAGLFFLAMFVLLVIFAIILPEVPETEIEKNATVVVDETEPNIEVEAHVETEKPKPIEKSDDEKMQEYLQSKKRISKMSGSSRMGTSSIYATALELAESYASNELAADAKYKDKMVRIRGNVDTVSKTFGDVVVHLSAGDFSFNTVFCYMKEKEVSSASLLDKGDSVAILGRVDGELMGNVIVKDCIIVGGR